MSEFLHIVANHHKDWINIINSFGQVNCAEDLVQEAYLRMDKYCTKDKLVKESGEVNKTYVWYVLRSVFNDYHNYRNKIDKTGLGTCYSLGYEESVDGFEEAYSELIYKINKEKSSWHWYDKQLFDIYTKSDMSLRDIAHETNISLTSVYNTIKNCKERLRNAVGEDYQDFINGDYDKI